MTKVSMLPRLLSESDVRLLHKSLSHSVQASRLSPIVCFMISQAVMDADAPAQLPKKEFCLNTYQFFKWTYERFPFDHSLRGKIMENVNYALKSFCPWRSCSLFIVNTMQTSFIGPAGDSRNGGHCFAYFEEGVNFSAATASAQSASPLRQT